MFKYTGIYRPGTKPEFIEGDVFKSIIPLIAKETTKYSLEGWDKVRIRLGENEWKILEVLWSDPNSNIPAMA